MTLQTDQLMKEAASVETTANPPPRTSAAAFDGHLFQTIDELRARHIDAPNTRQRMIHLIVALLAGSALFAGLYALMLFVE